MIFAALSEAADRQELLLYDGGLCRFHARRDGAVVIREILVLPAYRRRGIGRQLVAAVAAGYPLATLRARCPLAYEANAFWRACGFGIAWSEGGVNVWERHPA